MLNCKCLRVNLTNKKLCIFKEWVVCRMSTRITSCKIMQVHKRSNKVYTCRPPVHDVCTVTKQLWNIVSSVTLQNHINNLRRIWKKMGTQIKGTFGLDILFGKLSSFNESCHCHYEKYQTTIVSYVCGFCVLKWSGLHYK